MAESLIAQGMMSSRPCSSAPLRSDKAKVRAGGRFLQPQRLVELFRQIRVQKRDDGRRGFSRWHLERLSASPRGIERSESGLGLALIIPRGEPARQQS